MNSISKKLTRLVVLSVSSACLLMGGFGCWQELSRYSANKRNELRAASTAFGAAAASAVARKDRFGAMQALRGIAGLPGYRYASVRDLDDVIIAEVGSGARMADDLALSGAGDDVSPMRLFMTGTVSVDQPVYDDGQVVGRLQLVSDNAEVRSRLLAVALSALAGSAIALLVGLAISLRMQDALAKPLIRLTRIMSEIRRTHAYDAEIAIAGDDEIGVLALTFREMMEEVQVRDARLVRHQLRLEDDVADRTRELSKAKIEADEANATKSVFLATMSHEIRTPMNGMLVMADLLARTELPPRSRRYAEVIAQSGHGLLAIINDILDFSKIEAGMISLESIDFDPSEVVDRALTLYLARAQEQGLELASYVAPDVPGSMSGDPVRLGQIVGNLVGNAIKFTLKGSVTVRLDRLNDDLRISVIDTGIGIPPSKLDSIFNPFSQAEQSTTRRFGGTGLGLSICKSLADAMGAEIRVCSDEGSGTKFTVVLKNVAGDFREPGMPCTDSVFVDVGSAITRGVVAERLRAEGHLVVETLPDATHAILDQGTLTRLSSKPVPGRIVVLAPLGSGAIPLPDGVCIDLNVATPINKGDWTDILSLMAGREIAARPIAFDAMRRTHRKFKGLRVLVVDDSELNLEVASEALAQLGVTAELCNNGAEAVERVLACPPDIVFMDGSMPGMDGYSATQVIRRRESQSAIVRTPIYALTAHVVGPASEAWIGCGMDGCLHKPFTLEALEKVLAGLPNACSAARTEPPHDPGSVTDASLFDSEVLDSLREMGSRSGGSFIARVVDLFETGWPATIKSIRAAVEEKDSLLLAAAAHKLKSMSLNVGARGLAGLLQAMETGARDRGAFPSESAMAELSATAGATSRELRVQLLAACLEEPARLAG